MVAAAGCRNSANRDRTRARALAGAGYSRARRGAARCRAPSVEPASLVAAAQAALCDGSGLRCARAARWAFAFDLLGCAVEHRDALGTVTRSCRGSFRVQL